MYATSGQFVLASRESGTWTTRFDIDTSGNATFAGDIKINNTTPYLLNNDDEILTGSDAGGYYFGLVTSANASKALFIGDHNNYIRFDTDGDEAMRLDSSQNATFAGQVQVNKAKSGTGVENYDLIRLNLSGTGAVGDSSTIGWFSTAGTKTAGIEGISGLDNIAYGELAFHVRRYTTDTYDEAMRINNRGNVGIGTDSPDAKLEVASGQAKTVTSGVEFARFGTSNEASNYATLTCEVKGAAAAADRKWIFQTIESGVANAGNIVFQPSGGNVGIGTDSPQGKLNVTTGAGTSGAELQRWHYSTTPDRWNLRLTQVVSGNDVAWDFKQTNNNTDYGSVLTLKNGNVGIGGAPTVSLEIAKAGARMKMIDGTNQLNMGLWDGANYRFEGDANRPMFFTSYQGNINFGISGGTTMTVQSGGVGIGQTSPDTKLDVKAGATANQDDILWGVQINNEANGAATNYGAGLKFKNSSIAEPYKWAGIAGVAGSGYSNATDLAFYASSNSTADAVERMRITGLGHILLGNTIASLTSGVGFKYINDANVPYFGEVVNTTTGNGYSSFHHYNTNATFGGFRFYILNNGGIVNYSSNNVNLSDERVKHNIESSGNYLDKICSIPVRLFNYKDEPEGTDKNLGVIAQEVEAIAPELVNNDGFGETPEDGIPLKTVYSTDMMYALMKAIQELKAEIEILKNK